MSADRRFPGWVRYSSVGLELAGAVAGLALVGYWLDRRFGTTPWGILGGGAIALGLCAVGWLPTRRMAGADAVAAMVAGCGIGLLSAALAGWLLIVVGGETPGARMQRSFLAMVVRLAVVVVLGMAAALSGEFGRAPLLFWIGTAYVALLPLEVRLAIL